MADPNNIKKLLTAIISAGIQPVENSLQDLLLNRSVSTAVGYQLDILGKIVGQVRQGLDDDTYRRYIRARITTNRSDGVIEDLITISDLVVFVDSATYQVDNQGAAAVVLRILGIATSEDLANVVIDFLNDAVSAGVRVILESSAESPSDWLVMDTGHLDQKKLISARDRSI